MWFEIIPSFAIITGALALPGTAMYYMNRGMLGNPYRRSMRFKWDRHMYLRDRRLTNNPYRSNGLEILGDK